MGFNSGFKGLILLSTGKKIVPNGQERKTQKACEDGGEDKKRMDLRGNGQEETA